MARVVGVALDQHRDVEPRKLECIGDSFLVAEVGKHDQDAVDRVAVAAEQFGALLRVGVALDAAELGPRLAQQHGLDAERQRIVLLEMEALLRRTAATLPPYRRTPRPRRGRLPDAAGLNKAEQMAYFVALHYNRALSMSEIARAVRLHPNYAMTLFKTVFGTTLGDYVTHHRVSHAQRLLVSTDQKILAVALELGFGSVSRFNAALRRACGQSPRQYRAAHRGEGV